VTGGGDSNPGNSTGATPEIPVAPLPVPTLPVSFVIGLMAALLAIALSALRARRYGN